MTGEKDYSSTAIYDRPAYHDDERQALEAFADKLRDSVASVIERHLPCPDAIDPESDSFILVWDLIHHSAQPNWHKNAEQKNLKDLRRALIQAQRAWLRLHPVLRYTIAIKVAKMPPEVATAARDLELAPTRDNKTKFEAAWMVFEESVDEDVIMSANKLDAIWKVLPDIADFLEPGIRHAKGTINYGLEKGRTGWGPIKVIGHCRNIWRKRTGSDAPTRGLNEASPFGLFTKDIFEACELKSPRAAFDAWAKV